VPTGLQNRVAAICRGWVRFPYASAKNYFNLYIASFYTNQEKGAVINMKSIIIGTAGHIDHGKTSIVKILTNRDMDTLTEEKRRGITINLGFTNFVLPSGRILGIVDVPGHERFIKNMLAGATGIDVALIIIAATEGVMPQTREHVDILSYLGIKKSLIVLTKIDLVDDEFRELVKEDIEDYIQGTFLEGTKIVEVDSVSRKGLPELVDALDQLTANVESRNFNKKPRMNIDRVFTIKGQGTVVTGTLIEGTFRADDEVVILPQEITSRIRHLQVHQHSVDAAYAGQRTAINLSGVAVDQLKRGDTVALPESVYVTNILDVKFRIVRDTKFELGKFYRLKVYIGASEQIGRFVPITHKKAKAGDEGYAQILLEDEVAVLKGDRFVMRTITPVTTVGGGTIIDPAPVKYGKITKELIRLIERKDSASNQEVVETFIKKHPLAVYEEVCSFINKQSCEEELKELTAERMIRKLGSGYIHADNLSHFQLRIKELLNEYHHDQPLKKGIPKAELFGKWKGADKKQYEILLRDLEEQKYIKVKEGLVSWGNFVPELTSGQLRIKKELIDHLNKSGYQLPGSCELIEGDRDRQQVLGFLLDSGAVYLCDGYILTRELYSRARATAAVLFEKTGVVKLGEFRDQLGASRKYALLLLEKFDQEKLTIRQGEDRILNTRKLNGGA
jgi:selenocysteine-specific elongation factor